MSTGKEGRASATEKRLASPWGMWMMTRWQFHEWFHGNRWLQGEENTTATAKEINLLSEEFFYLAQHMHFYHYAVNGNHDIAISRIRMRRLFCPQIHRVCGGGRVLNYPTTSTTERVSFVLVSAREKRLFSLSGRPKRTLVRNDEKKYLSPSRVHISYCDAIGLCPSYPFVSSFVLYYSVRALPPPVSVVHYSTLLYSTLKYRSQYTMVRLALSRS